MTLYVRMLNPAGTQELANFQKFVRLDWARKENEVGTLTLDLPPNYPLSLFNVDNRFEIWRSIGNRLFLEGETVFFLRDWQFSTQQGKNQIHLEAFDANYIFGYDDKGRTVPYNDLAYVEKVDYCDDMMKAIARENLGSLALDTTRDLSTYLTIQANKSEGASSHKAFQFQILLKIFQELATESFQRGTYLAFDTVYTSQSMLEFRTYKGMRGTDHRRTSSNPVIINMASKSLEDPLLDFNHTDEVTYVYAGGQSAGDVRAIYPLGDDARIGLSPFNRREQFVDASNTADADELESEARTALQAGTVRPVLTGRIVDTKDIVYGLNFGFGDVVVAEYSWLGIPFSFDAHVEAIHGTYENGTLTFDNKIRGEL